MNTTVNIAYGRLLYFTERTKELRKTLEHLRYNDACLTFDRNAEAVSIVESVATKEAYLEYAKADIEREWCEKMLNGLFSVVFHNGAPSPDGGA